MPATCRRGRFLYVGRGPNECVTARSVAPTAVLGQIRKETMRRVPRRVWRDDTKAVPIELSNRRERRRLGPNSDTPRSILNAHRVAIPVTGLWASPNYRTRLQNEHPPVVVTGLPDGSAILLGSPTDRLRLDGWEVVLLLIRGSSAATPLQGWGSYSAKPEGQVSTLWTRVKPKGVKRKWIFRGTLVHFK